MVTVRYKDCTGCGDCVSVCPNDAIILQNAVATIDQALCEGCCACVDACPEGAILTADEEPEIVKTVVIPNSLPAERPPIDTRIAPRSWRSLILPTVSSVLLWTGQEVLPRLANAALRSFDRRTNTIDQDLKGSESKVYTRHSPMNVRGQRRRQRRFRRS